jgi:uncharacterized membrane protein YphA (DoxX/SURF4 family)
LSASRYRIGLLTVAALVALRLGLGCHFFYEGVWKITHKDEFTAEPFLSQAKGPMANLFYAMIPDLYAQSLKPETVKDEKTGKETSRIKLEPVTARWTEIRQNLLSVLAPDPDADQESAAAYKKFEADSEKILQKHEKQLEKYFQDQAGDIQAFFGVLDRYENDPAKNQDATFQKERRWKKMLELRADAKVWIKELEDREQTYLNVLRDAMDQPQRDRADAQPCNWRIWQWPRMKQINFAVTWGLTAIGFCLLIGFFTRLAALGGACFMVFVVMTQPAWPTIYPPDPNVVGHALLINKDFIELLALLAISTTAVGRWGGVDYWIHTLIVEPFRARGGKKDTGREGKL